MKEGTRERYRKGKREGDVERSTCASSHSASMLL